MEKSIIFRRDAAPKKILFGARGPGLGLQFDNFTSLGLDRGLRISGFRFRGSVFGALVKMFRAFWGFSGLALSMAKTHQFL